MAEDDRELDKGADIEESLIWMSGHIARSAVRYQLAAGRMSRPGTLDPGRPACQIDTIQPTGGYGPAGYTGPAPAGVAFSYLVYAAFSLDFSCRRDCDAVPGVGLLNCLICH